MICWIGWPHRKREADDTMAQTLVTLDLVDQVRGLEARMKRVLAARAAARLRAEADAALRALTPTETAHATAHDPRLADDDHDT